MYTVLTENLRPKDKGQIAIEKTVSQEKEALHAMEGHTGSTREGQEAEGEEGTVSEPFYGGFCRKEWVSQGRQT